MRDHLYQPKKHPRQDYFGGRTPFESQFDKEDPLDEPQNFIYNKRRSEAPRVEKDPMIWDPPEDLPYERKS